MDQPPIPFDLARMFLGDAPPLFFLEILVRTLIVYIYTMGLIRWIGGRGVAQLSMVEFLLVIALGSAVGDAAFYPDVPLLHALAVITIVVLLNKGLDWLILHYDTAKRTIDGVPVAIVEDGRLLRAGMEQRSIGAAEVISSLRQNGVRNLGEVEHAFMEGDGVMSIFRFNDPRPGLQIVPPAEVRRPAALTDPAVAPEGKACCLGCGTLEEAVAVLPDGLCPECGGCEWTAPVTRPAHKAE
ncbi:DUF421 domain-containing protein [Frigidibacter sp.]|uniref:DUF421 domain-containing protein n=1 Tax=Frigidibacter sp. TaxID=2586418 RepID=UPI0027359286|nr:YetF domain-containing protein [Frigidibacter sp.]MDP3341824.1 DUF421 domain-containing protein [Frigidibacter sp.]